MNAKPKTLGSKFKILAAFTNTLDDFQLIKSVKMRQKANTKWFRANRDICQALSLMKCFLISRSEQTRRNEPPVQTANMTPSELIKWNKKCLYNVLKEFWQCPSLLVNTKIVPKFGKKKAGQDVIDFQKSLFGILAINESRWWGWYEPIKPSLWSCQGTFMTQNQTH